MLWQNVSEISKKGSNKKFSLAELKVTTFSWWRPLKALTKGILLDLAML